MADTCMNLVVNRSLVDSSFDGYKLSLDNLPTYRIDIRNGVDTVQLGPTQYSLQHISAYGMHNYLKVDHNDPRSCYYVNQNWEVVKVSFVAGADIENGVVVFAIPNLANQQSTPERCQVTMCFLSSDWLLLADGSGWLYILDTCEEKWRMKHSCQPIENQQFFLIDGATYHNTEGHTVECILKQVCEYKPGTDPEDDKNPPFVTKLHWITFSASTELNNSRWALSHYRILEGSSLLNYTALERDGSAIIVASDKSFKFTHDSQNPVEDRKEKVPDKSESPPAYTWGQSEEDVWIQFTVSPNTSKTDIVYKLSGDHVEFGLKDGAHFLYGELHKRVDIEASTWTLEGQRLELTLSKHEEGTMWPTVVIGDSRGHMTVDPDVVARIHEQLAHTTSDSNNPDPNKEMPYNSQELEDCDSFPDENSVLTRIDGKSHDPTHKINLGSHQWLFNVQLASDNIPAVCLRHDVDGLLWQLRSSPKPMEPLCDHISTFNALGYVQASKRDKKFAMCSPDRSYAVICDCVRHVYIYYQPESIGEPLRNRKTGQKIGSVAKQHVISLDSVNTILGVVATDEILFILTGNILYVIKVKKEKLIV